MAESDSRRATSESPPDWQPTGFVFDDNGWAARLRATACDMVIKGGSIRRRAIRRLVSGWELC